MYIWSLVHRRSRGAAVRLAADGERVGVQRRADLYMYIYIYIHLYKMYIYIYIHK